jgi:rsbT co-antagonist protein RsbR
MTGDSKPPSAEAERIATIVHLLNEVTGGTYSSRLPELHESDAFAQLFRAINEMVDTLEAARDTAEKFQTELTERLATIEQQRAAIRELSTPVIEVWDRVLCLPVVGVMDTTRGAEMTESLLRGVVEKRARCTILDVTGIEVMDTATADHFLRMAKAVRLLGAECVITGISPSIAQTIVHMGVNLDQVRTHRSLRDALARFVLESIAKGSPGRRT